VSDQPFVAYVAMGSPLAYRPWKRNQYRHGEPGCDRYSTHLGLQAIRVFVEAIGVRNAHENQTIDADRLGCIDGVTPPDSLSGSGAV
jgi:hypothetical protein